LLTIPYGLVCQPTRLDLKTAWPVVAPVHVAAVLLPRRVAAGELSVAQQDESARAGQQPVHFGDESRPGLVPFAWYWQMLRGADSIVCYLRAPVRSGC
jgi:hypothetical protein